MRNAKRTIRFTFEAGETTCAHAPGKFCRFVETRVFGFEWSCGLFERRLYDNGKGWLARCPECLEAEKRQNELAQ